MIIGVDADDLAEIIGDRKMAQEQLRECVQSAQNSALEWHDELQRVNELYEGFRRAVQEATGLDQPGLLSDDVLVARVRGGRVSLMLQDASVEIDGVFVGRTDVTYQPHGVGNPFPGFPIDADNGAPAGPRQWEPGDLVAVPVAGFVGRFHKPDSDGEWAILTHASELGHYLRVPAEQVCQWDGVTNSPWRLDDYAQVQVPDGWFHGVISRLDGDKVTLTDPRDPARQVTATVDLLWPHAAPVASIEREIEPVMNEIEAYDRAMTEAGVEARPLKTRADRARERADDGPPTETMPAVEEPPAVADTCTIGRVFTRGYDWDLGDLMPLAMVNRVGDWWEFSHIPDGAPNGDQAVYNCPARDITHSFEELLHMHGTLWEVLDNSEQPSVAEQALVDDEAARDE